MTGYILGQDTSIVLKTPNGGDKWLIGLSRDITWTRNDTNITNVKIQYTTNNGTSWLAVVQSVTASLGTYSWRVPNTPSTNCKVRISNTGGDTIYCVSANVFTIRVIPLVTLQDINAYTDTATAYWNSPLATDTVRVQATVLVTPIIHTIGDRRTIFYYAAAWGAWVQDATSAPWSGLEVYQADSNATGTFFDLCDTATTYEFTGIVTPYGAATELALITAPIPIPVKQISSELKRPDPIPLTIDSCWDSHGNFNLNLRKYQGMYVSFNADASHALITSGLVTGTGSTAGGFTINDSSGHKLSMYAQSKFYRTGPNYTLRPSYTAPPNGSSLPYVRGILEGYQPTSGWIWEIVPMYPGDLGEPTMSPPQFSSCTRDHGIVQLNTPVTVRTVVDGLVGAKVTKVTLYSRVNGVDNTPTTMTRGTGADTSVYTGVIPAVTSGDSSYVEYYCKAIDNDNLTSTYPSNIVTSRYAYYVFADPNKPLTIQLVRYSPLGSGYSAYNGYPVTVSGVVTADTSNIPGSNANNSTRVFIQNGEGPWSGIVLGPQGPDGQKMFNLKQGDLITVTGTPVLALAYGTRLDTLSNLTIVSHGNSLPAAHVMKTSSVGFAALGDTITEPWNGCIVTYNNVTIDSANADGPTINYGESYCIDTAKGNHTRITWSDGRTKFFDGPAGVLVHKGDYFKSITGILGYTHSNYKLCPRNDTDLFGFINDVKNVANSVPVSYKLNQNYPNPFNPSTIISYDLPKSGLVTIRIYNILGQQVRTLVNESQIAGTHQVSFNASSLTSGVYFYSLSTGSFSQVKKMMLIK
jgi:hypothetical protein